MFIWLKRLLLTLTITGLLASNILTLTSATFNAALSGLVGTTLGVRTVSAAMQARLAQQDRTLRQQAQREARRKAATRKFGQRLTTRTKRVAAKSVAAIPAEAIPFLGVAVLIADTGYELYAACESIRDLDELYAALDIGEESADETLDSVCNPQLPEPEAVWNDVVDQVDQWWDDLAEAV